MEALLCFDKHMYMTAVVAPTVSHDEIQAKLTAHYANLEQTGFTGRPTFRSFGDVLLTFDASSPYASFAEADGGFRLTGGFRTADASEPPSETEIASYATILLDTSNEQPTLRTEADPNYPWPLYFASKKHAAAIGNDVHAVAIALGLSELNTEAVTELIAFQYVLGRSSTVAGINRIWPGERLSCPATARLVPRALTPERVFEGLDYEVPDLFDIDAQTDRTFGSLVDAIDKLQLGGDDTVVQLSGGLDSRLTAVATARAGTSDVNCITMNLEDGEELIIAAEIARRFGFAHETLELPESGQEDLRAAWLLTGGQAPLHAAANNIPYYRSQLKGREHVRIVGAWPADLLIGAFVPSFAEFSDPLATPIALKYWLAEFTDNEGARQLLRGSKRAKRHLRRVRKQLAQQVAEPHGDTAAQRVSHWAFAHCAPVFTFLSPARMCANVLEVAPVMAPAFVRHLFELRGQDIAQRNFYQRMIWEKAPELRDIHYHNTGKLLSPEYEGPLPSMSWKLRALLALPPSAYRFVNRLQNKRAQRVQPPELSVQASHWSKLFEAHIRKPLTLSGDLRVDTSRVTHPYARVGISATVLACAWSRDYLRSFESTSTLRRMVSPETLEVAKVRTQC